MVRKSLINSYWKKASDFAKFGSLFTLLGETDKFSTAKKLAFYQCNAKTDSFDNILKH